MQFPVITLKKDKLFVIDNLLSNTEADCIATSVFNKPKNTQDSFYLWNQLYSIQQGNTLAYNHESRQLIEQVQFRCMQVMKNELALPTLKLEYTGIALSNKSYAYHADNSFPEEAELRDMGIPDSKSGEFSSYLDRSTASWIAGNYPLRYYSSILFLNSNFEGGQEVFPQHNIEVAPRQGRLIIFPSTKEYVHGFRSSTGTRYTVSSWYHRVFNYYDQKSNEQTKNMDNIRDVLIAIEDNNLLSNV